MLRYCLILLVLVTSGLGKLAPDFIHPCSDTNRDCLIKASQDSIEGFCKGLPELGVPPLDPFHIDEMVFPLNGIEIILTDADVFGLGKCIIDDMNSELEKRFFQMKFHCNLTIDGQYSAEGKLLQYKINGGGHAKITLTNLRMNLDINTKYTKDKHGFHHFSLKKYNYTFDYGDKMTFDLEEPFRGNKEISARIVELLNKEWKAVAEDFGKPIVDKAVSTACNFAERFFSKVPYEELIGVPCPED